MRPIAFVLIAAVCVLADATPSNCDEGQLAPLRVGEIGELPEPCLAFTPEQTPEHPPLIRYPQISIDKHEVGEVVVVFSILPDGTIADAHVLVSSGHYRLDEAARSSIEKWRVVASGSDSPVPNSNQTALKVDFILANGGTSVHATLACRHPAAKVLARTSHTPVIYPDAVRQQGLQGDVLLGFTVRHDGSVANAHIVQTSGSDLLDRAAIQTAQTWTYTAPLTDVERTACVTYRAPENSPSAKPLVPGCSVPPHPWDRPPEPVGDHACHPGGFAASAVALGMIVSFDITPEGDVTNVAVETSSGSAGLDEMAVECAKGWHYKPAILNGAPVSAHWEVQVGWRFR